MAATIVHTVALEQVNKYAIQLGIDISAGGNINFTTAYKAMISDIEGMHASESNLLSRVINQLWRLNKQPGSDVYNEGIYHITHYLVDCHSIGHIVGTALAEVLCEYPGELVSRKDSFPDQIITRHMLSLDDWITVVQYSIQKSRKMYAKNYVLKLPNAVRRSVRAAREFTIELMKMEKEGII